MTTPPLTAALTASVVPTTSHNALAAAANTTGGQPGHDTGAPANTPAALEVTLVIGGARADVKGMAAERGTGVQHADPALRGHAVVLAAEGVLDLHRKLEGALRTAGVTIPPHPLDGHEERDAELQDARGQAREVGYRDGWDAAARQLKVGAPGDELAAAAIEYVEGIDRVRDAVRATGEEPAEEAARREEEAAWSVGAQLNLRDRDEAVRYALDAATEVGRFAFTRGTVLPALLARLDQGAPVAPDDVKRPAATEGTWADNLEHLPAALVGTLTALLQDRDDATHRVGALAAARATLGDITTGELLDAARFVSTGMTPAEED